MTPTDIKHLLPYLLRGDDHIIIDSQLRSMLLASPDNSLGIFHIESSPDTVNWRLETLPVCLPGEYRLWSAKEWATTDNRTIITKQRLARERDERQALANHILEMKSSIIAHFQKLGMPRDIVEKTLLANSDTATLESIIQSINQPTSCY